MVVRLINIGFNNIVIDQRIIPSTRTNQNKLKKRK
jgi:regulator of extracellular matrix RemA (YlzA/DUF370 family)